jgi:hypothetical protein
VRGHIGVALDDVLPSLGGQVDRSTEGINYPAHGLSLCIAWAPTELRDTPAAVCSDEPVAGSLLMRDFGS